MLPKHGLAHFLNGSCNAKQWIILDWASWLRDLATLLLSRVPDSIAEKAKLLSTRNILETRASEVDVMLPASFSVALQQQRVSIHAPFGPT